MVVVENKAFEALPGAIDQLAGYVEHARREYQSDEVCVHGVLVALTVGDETEAAADQGASSR